ncbi:MAG: alginate export family protein, partial [Pseudomonadales bacterium]|nr:alginate export family protein [Pseudomonadales bacterium]
MTTAGTLGVSSGANADAFIDALTSGKTFATTRLRYESVEQDNALDDATAVTLRTRLGYTTGDFMGFTATAEFEDGRVAFGEDEYAPLSQGFSVIGDPEFTEVDQAFIQYNSDIFTTKIGRQVVTLDNQRFIGHVAWRNNRQTFDAARF